MGERGDEANVPTQRLRWRLRLLLLLHHAAAAGVVVGDVVEAAFSVLPSAPPDERVRIR
jgi:hypothetical protein